MLVAVGLGSLVLGLLWSALDQANRIELILGDEQRQLEHNALRLDWFQRTVARLLPRPKESPDHFVGDAKQFTALSGQSLDVDAVAREHVTWAIAYHPDEGTSALMYRGEKGVPLSILEWQGDSGRFRYLNADKIEDRWPPTSADPAPMLPTAIIVDTGIAGMEVLLAASRADEIQLAHRANLEKP
jgi:hypothetical protein